MGWLRLENATTLDAINATQDGRQLYPVVGDRGGLLLCDDLLSDCGPGQTWEAYSEILHGLQPTDDEPVRQVSPVSPSE